MERRAKSISLLLFDGTMQGVVGIEDSSWRGEMYSAPRQSMEGLLGSGACDKYGVYLLLSRDRVYVGQSSDLARRLSQHVSGKSWWDNAVILTTKDDGLSHTDIDWLERALIERARSVGRLDCDNRQRGNPTKVDRFREVFLNQYLDEALFLMDIVGIPVFREPLGGRRVGTTDADTPRIDVTDVHNRLAFGKRLKRLAIDYAVEHGAEITDNVNYAVLKEDGSEFFVNPRVTAISSDWSIVLNDTSRCELLVLRVPANAIRIGGEGSRGLLLRRDNMNQIDLHIDAQSLRDRRSGTGFSRFLASRIAY